MIQVIGAMHTALRVKKRPEDERDFRVKIKKPQREQQDDQDDAPARRKHKERGQRA